MSCRFCTTLECLTVVACLFTAACSSNAECKSALSRRAVSLTENATPDQIATAIQNNIGDPEVAKHCTELLNQTLQQDAATRGQPAIRH